MLLGPRRWRRSIDCQRFGQMTQNNCSGELKVKTAAAGLPLFQTLLKRPAASPSRASSSSRMRIMACVVDAFSYCEPPPENR